MYYMTPFKLSQKYHKHPFFSTHRTGDGTGVCFCIHCWHLCSGLPTGCCLPLLSRGSDAEGTDHTWVVLHTEALQPGSAGQHQGMPGQVLVHLLALSIDTFPAAGRRHKLQVDWSTRAQEVGCALIGIFSLQFQYSWSRMACCWTCSSGCMLCSHQTISSSLFIWKTSKKCRFFNSFYNCFSSLRQSYWF